MEYQPVNSAEQILVLAKFIAGIEQRTVAGTTAFIV